MSNYELEKIKRIHTKVDWIRFKAYFPQMAGEEKKRIAILDITLKILGLSLIEAIKTKRTNTYRTQESIVLIAKDMSLTVELTGSWCSTDSNFERSKIIFQKLNEGLKYQLENKLFVLSRIDLATDWLNATPESL